MYSKRAIHKNIVEGNAYISAGDPYIGGPTDKSPWWSEMKKENFKPIRCQVSSFLSLYLISRRNRKSPKPLHLQVIIITVLFDNPAQTANLLTKILLRFTLPFLQRVPQNAERGNFHKKTYIPLECSEITKYKSSTTDERIGKGKTSDELVLSNYFKSIIAN